MADRGDDKPPRGGKKGKAGLRVVGGTDGSPEDQETGSPGRSGSARRPREEEGPGERVGGALKGARPVPKSEEGETGSPGRSGGGSTGADRSGSARREAPKLSKKERKTASECANLDQNDRDNARRLDAWYGENLAFVPGMGWIVWAGTHWEIDVGELAAAQLAQDLVDKIKLEPIVMAHDAADKEIVGEAAEIAVATTTEEPSRK